MHYDFVNFDEYRIHHSEPARPDGFNWETSNGRLPAFMQETGILSRAIAYSRRRLFGLNPAVIISPLFFCMLQTRSFVSLLAQHYSHALAERFRCRTLWSSSNARGVSRVDRRAEDVLSTFFFILTIWAYCRYVESETSKLKTQTQNLHPLLCLFALGR